MAGLISVLLCWPDELAGLARLSDSLVVGRKLPQVCFDFF